MSKSRDLADLPAGGGDLNVDSGTLFVDASENRVGIGTSSPATNLDARGANVTTFDTISTIRIQGTNAYNSGNAGSGIAFTGLYDASDNATTFAVISGIKETTSNSDFDGALVFGTRDVGGDLNIERMRIDSSGNVGIGTSSPDTLLHLSSADGNAVIRLERNDTTINVNDVYGSIEFEGKDSSASSSGVRGSITGLSDGTGGNMSLVFSTAPFTGSNTERMRIDSSGRLFVGKTASTLTTSGFECWGPIVYLTRDGGNPLFINRLTNDGSLISFRQDSVEEGYINVSGGTVSLVGGHLARWSRITDDSKDTSIVKGTVMTNLDEMVVWSHDAIDEVLDEEGNVVTEAKEAYTEDNEQLNKMAVSSVEGDPNVAGVFVSWDEDDDFNDMNIAMTGDMVIRIAQGVTVERGDLLMSAGDGTAKPQGDDIVRSKTIAKVTSTHVSHTYDDGSYLVPCVLMAC